jgi:hypothetical protein
MSFPDRNPFPPQAVTTIEGIDWSAFVEQPTFERPAVRRVLEVMRSYQQVHSAERVGRAIALHGDHGTGKTHCIAYALASMWTSEQTEDQRPLILYARADNNDALSLYRRLTARLSAAELRTLVGQSFAGYAAQAYELERRSSPDQRQKASRSLHETPDLVRVAIEQGDISLSGIVDLQEKDIERVQGGLGNFERALQSLFNPQLSTLAYEWLTGHELAGGDLRLLGVQGNLVTSSDVQTAVHILTTVARRAGRAIYVAIDQAEAFLIDESNRLSKRAAGTLRSLLEVVVSEGGCFAASMNNESWASLPRDLRQRLGTASVTMLPLTLAEANGVLAAYLVPWRERDGGPPLLTADAVEELLVLSGGNTRRFLQACFLAFQRASVDSRQIDGTLVVEEARRDFAATSPNEAEVKDKIAHHLRRIGAAFSTETTIGDEMVNFAVLEAGRPAILLQVTQPVFALDEANRAVGHVDLADAAKAEGLSLILIVVGYSSPDVLRQLEKIAERVFVAASADYSTKLADVIEEEVGKRRGAASGISAQDLDQIRNELVNLRNSRAADENAVLGALREVAEAQAAAALPQQLADFRRTWSLESQRLHDDLKRTRAEQLKQDVQEFAELHSAYLKVSRERISRITIAITGTAGLLAVALVLITAMSGSSFRPQFVAAVVGALGLAGAMITFVNVGTRSSSSYDPVTTIEDVRRLALARIAKRNAFQSPHSEDPYERFAALLRPASVRVETWVKVLAAEPSRFLRLEIARMLCERDEMVKVAVRGDPDTMSLVIEAAARRGNQDLESELSQSIAELPSPLISLAVFSGLPVKPVSLLGAFFQELESGVRVNDEREPSARLARAYTSDDDRMLLDAIHGIPERDLRRATNELSPQDRRGLCSFYWLKAVPQLDEIYTFFRKALLLSTTGISATGNTHDSGRGLRVPTASP